MALRLGSPAPDFALPNQDGNIVRLRQFAGQWLLLYWYPKADTPGCTVQAEGLRDQREAFDDLGCTILGASFDEVADIKSFRDRYQLGFDLLSDATAEVGRSYEVAGDAGDVSHAERIAYLISPAQDVRVRYEVVDPEFFAETVLDDLDTAVGDLP